MPCLEVTMPRASRERKELLSAILTRAFSEATGFAPEIFSIRYHEYGPGETATAGKIWDGGADAPFLHLVLYCPRLRRSQKKALVAGFTAAFTESRFPASWKPIVHIAEHSYDNVGVEGQLLSDACPELKGRRFYYSTDDAPEAKKP